MGETSSKAPRFDDLDGGRPNVLVIDDTEEVRSAVGRWLERSGANVAALSDGIEAVRTVEAEDIELVLLDIDMPHISGLDVLVELKERFPELAVVMMSGDGSAQTAVTAIGRGAYDYLTKPIHDPAALLVRARRAIESSRLRRRNAALETALETREAFEGIVGSSPQMQSVFETVEAVAGSAGSVLVIGESGTGKELVASAIHHRSDRAGGPFVAVNCTAFPESLIEAELFGHEKGAFTGATAARRGVFETAHGGTLFLDEIGDLPKPLQAKLLRVLQEGEIRRVGSEQTRNVDVRVVTATHVNLPEAIAAGRFREDLYYRLNVIEVSLPALRDRREDVPELAHHFLRKYNEREKKSIEGFTHGAMEALGSATWTGNVRQLENVVQRAVILCREDIIDIEQLPADIGRRTTVAGAVSSTLTHLPYGEAKEAAISAFERRYVEAVLRESGGVVKRAARQAKVDPTNFRRLLKRLGIDPKGFAPSSDSDT